MLAKEVLHPTALGGIAIRVATWKDFDIYLFLDNEQNDAQQKLADSGSNFWFGFHDKEGYRIINIQGSVPIKTYHGVRTRGPISNDFIPLSSMRNVLLETYPDDGTYFGVWDLAGYDKTPVNVPRAVDFIKSVVTSKT